MEQRETVSYWKHCERILVRERTVEGCQKEGEKLEDESKGSLRRAQTGLTIYNQGGPRNRNSQKVQGGTTTTQQSGKTNTTMVNDQEFLQEHRINRKVWK